MSPRLPWLGRLLRVAVLLPLGAAPLAAESAQVVGVIDADTYRVRIGGDLRTVRLAGIDAPDPARPRKAADYYGQEALLYASRRLAEVQQLELSVDPKAGAERDGVLVRNARLADGTDLAVELLASGYATVAGNSTRFDELRQIERQAKREKRGLWDASNFEAYKKYLVDWETGARDLGIGPDLGFAIMVDTYFGAEVWLITFERY